MFSLEKKGVVFGHSCLLCLVFWMSLHVLLAISLWIFLISSAYIWDWVNCTSVQANLCTFYSWPSMQLVGEQDYYLHVHVAAQWDTNKTFHSRRLSLSSSLGCEIHQLYTCLCKAGSKHVRTWTEHWSVMWGWIPPGAAHFSLKRRGKWAVSVGGVVLPCLVWCVSITCTRRGGQIGELFTTLREGKGHTWRERWD